MSSRTKAIRSFQNISLVAAAILLASAVTTHAYIDPGTGSTLVQLVTGGTAGALVVARLYWRRLKDKINDSLKAPAPTPSDETAPPVRK